MSTYIGPLGDLVEMPCLSGLEVESSAPSLRTGTDLYGRVITATVGDATEQRTWSCNIGARPLAESSALRAFVLSRGYGPWRMLACDAVRTNAMTPWASVLAHDSMQVGAGWTGGTITRAGSIDAVTQVGPAWAADGAGTVSTDDPLVTTTADGTVLIPDEYVRPIGGGAYLLVSDLVSSRLPAHVILDTDTIHYSPVVPVVGGQRVTGSVYINGGDVGLAWINAAGAHFATTMAPTLAPRAGLERRVILTAVPAGAVGVRLRVVGASRAAQAAVTWTTLPRPWVAGGGADAVRLSPLSMTHHLLVEGRELSGATYTVQEVS